MKILSSPFRQFGMSMIMITLILVIMTAWASSPACLANNDDNDEPCRRTDSDVNTCGLYLYRYENDDDDDDDDDDEDSEDNDSEDEDSEDDEESSSSATTTTWILAGRDYAAHETLGWTHDDLVVSFTQHSRRAFPRFHRYYQMMRQKQVKQQDPHQKLAEQVDHPFHYTYVPAFTWPFQCHKSLDNAIFLRHSNNSEQWTLQTKRAIPRFEPIFVDCGDQLDHAVGGTAQTMIRAYHNLLADLDKDDDNNLIDLDQDENAICLDMLTVRYNDSNNSINQYVDNHPPQKMSVAKRPVAQGEIVTGGPALHLHLTELQKVMSSPNTKYKNIVDDVDGEEYEGLIRYTWSHPDTDLLLLETAPLVQFIQLTTEKSNDELPNVRLQLSNLQEEAWDLIDLDGVLYNTSDIIFAEERPVLAINYVALRDIQPGDKLILESSSFCSPHGAKRLPDDFYPPMWLKRESEIRGTPFWEFDPEPLRPGQVKPAQLTRLSSSATTESLRLGEYLHRVGLPPQLTQELRMWAHESGLLDIISRYILDDRYALRAGTQDKFRVNGGTWWTRRFDGDWMSNMHYITPDDEVSTKEFFGVLARGGFDEALGGIGKHFGLKQLTAYYPSLIAVSHCVQAYMHSDSKHPNLFNMIWPLVQVDDAEPELVLGEDGPYELHVPYKYERDVGIMVGNGGMHGTAPCDYREKPGAIRVVVSVYFGDFSDEAALDEEVEEWGEPPYPNYHEGDLRFALSERIHWSRDDPHRSIGKFIPLPSN